jgi:hypothetical protein
MSIKWMQKNIFFKEFIIAYDEELSALADSTKLIYIDDISKNSNDYYEKIKKTADAMLENIASMTTLKHIILDDESQLFVEFKHCNDKSNCFNCNSLFKIYDKNNIEICKIKMPSVLSLCHQRLHEDLIEFQVLNIIDGEIVGLKNKYNVPELLKRTNNTKNIIDNMYNKIGLKERVQIRNIDTHAICDFQILFSIENYYDGCLSSLFFLNRSKVPLILIGEKEEDYKKRFFKNSMIKDYNIDVYFKNFKNIYEMLKKVNGLKVYCQMFKEDLFSNLVNTIPYFELVFDDDFFYRDTFYIVMKECFNINSILNEYIFINDFKSDLFVVRDLVKNKDEMLEYLKTIKY